MIKIVPGNINSGKTRRMIELYRELGGAGFVSVKHIEDGILHGYDLLKLGTDLKIPFARYRELTSDGWKEAFAYGPFSFSRDGLEAGIGILRQAMKNGISPLFIDEIGPLELEGLGFHDIFEEIVRSGTDAIIACRELLIDEVIRHFGIEEWEVLREVR